jgi:SpoVK/Ycf46/Vps4 family AAA+-type ATPase
VIPIEVPAPGPEERAHNLAWFAKHGTGQRSLELWAPDAEVVENTAGLSLHGMRQLLLGALHAGGRLEARDVADKVGEFIERQLGEDVVEFQRPSHGLDAVVGFTRLKAFLREELIPRFRSSGKDALTGAAVCGPIGGWKSFIFEAVASELDFPVLVLKNIRSQWYGQTDVIFERLRRTLVALGKVMIFVDEADTQFGSVGPAAHDTERRLTGKIQAMISDPELRGRVVWLLMTARIHNLSPDLRRPGRVGDLIIPILDPEDKDRREFLQWVLRGAKLMDSGEDALQTLGELTQGWSAAAFASLRSTLIAASVRAPLDLDRLLAIVSDQIPPAIERTRRYQTLQALLNCTRRSLLPDPKVTDEERESWQSEMHALERAGIH